MLSIDELIWDAYEFTSYHPACPPVVWAFVTELIGAITFVRAIGRVERPRAAIVIEGTTAKIVAVGRCRRDDPELAFAALRAVACWILCARGEIPTPRRVYEVAAALALPTPAVRHHYGVRGRSAEWLAKLVGVPIAIARMRVRRVFAI